LKDAFSWEDRSILFADNKYYEGKKELWERREELGIAEFYLGNGTLFSLAEELRRR